ncbi:MAG: hypothetical protein QOE58_166, partial [Actinomycetota bacterium]|nr:hypothetical protein [Actinomycetota bacterium]
MPNLVVPDSVTAPTPMTASKAVLTTLRLLETSFHRASRSIQMGEVHGSEFTALRDDLSEAHETTSTFFHEIQRRAESVPSTRPEASVDEMADICMYDDYLGIVRTRALAHTELVVAATPLFA